MSNFKQETNFKEKIDMSQLWLMHVNRTNMASGDMFGSYDAFVRQQLRLLPTDMQAWVDAQKDQYLDDVEVLVYKTDTLGNELGSEKDPIVWNKDRTDLGNSTSPGFSVTRFEDGSVDWSDPLIYSPQMENVQEVDYEKYNLVIMAAAERAGLSWNVEIHTHDMGDAPPKGKKKRHQLQQRKTSSGKKLPNIPVGYDTKIISTIPDTNLSIIDWNGTKVVQGLGYSPIFFDLIQARTNKGSGTIIGMGGSPGDGKTWFGKRLAQILNRTQPRREFNPYLQIPFTQEHFLWLLSDKSPLKQGDVIILDEAHFAAGSRNWFKEDQKDLVDMIASARNMGLIVILVVLHMSMLDKILRQFTMAFYIHLESPGKATAYKTYTPRFNDEMYKARIGPVTLQVPWVSECEHPWCLKCDYLDTCYNGRAIYERRKAYFQQMKIEASMERRHALEKQNISNDEMLEALHKHHDKLTLTSHGNIDNAVIQFIITQELELDVGKAKSRDLAKLYKLKYPDAEYG